MQRDFHILQRGIPGVILIFFLLQSILQKKLEPFISGLVISLLFYFFFTLSYYSGIKITVKRMFGEGRSKGILGEHILELTNTEIIERTSVNEMKTNISFIGKS